MASAPVLTLALLFCEQRGLPVPTTLIGSTDKNVRQLRSLISDVILMLSEYRWPDQRVRVTWNSVAGQDQGALDSIFGAGYYGLVPDSMWNVTRKMRIYGPVSDQIWQALQTLPNAGPEFQSWITGGHLYVSPALPAGQQLSAVMITKNVVAHPGIFIGDPITYGDFVTQDSDYFFFPNNVFLRCLEYKWRKAKGEPGWEDDYNETMSLIAKSVAKDTAPKIQMGVTHRGPQPGIVIPAGSWNV